MSNLTPPRIKVQNLIGGGFTRFQSRAGAPVDKFVLKPGHLRATVHTSPGNSRCTVCLSPFNSSKTFLMAAALPCGHVYCVKCILDHVDYQCDVHWSCRVCEPYKLTSSSNPNNHRHPNVASSGAPDAVRSGTKKSSEEALRPLDRALLGEDVEKNLARHDASNRNPPGTGRRRVTLSHRCSSDASEVGNFAETQRGRSMTTANKHDINERLYRVAEEGSTNKRKSKEYTKPASTADHARNGASGPVMTGPPRSSAINDPKGSKRPTIDLTKDEVMIESQKSRKRAKAVHEPDHLDARGARAALRRYNKTHGLQCTLEDLEAAVTLVNLANNGTQTPSLAEVLEPYHPVL